MDHGVPGLGHSCLLDNPRQFISCARLDAEEDVDVDVARLRLRGRRLPPCLVKLVKSNADLSEWHRQGW